MKNIIAGVAAAVILAMVLLGYLNSRPVSPGEAVKYLKDYFEKAGTPGKSYSGVQALVYSPGTGINKAFAFGASTAAGDGKLHPQQPFHIASIGKLFTAVLIMKLKEEGRLKLSDPACNYTGENSLEGIFTYKGVDYKKEVTIGQLLGHTSGAADYFEDPVKTGMTMPVLIIKQPDTVWTPQALLDFARKNQEAVGAPGSGFHYSDTGYIILGLIAEKIEKKPFHEILKKRFFTPLKMKDSYMPLRSMPAELPVKPMADLWFMGKQACGYKSISADWAGGGIVSTTEDLLAFQRALHEEKLIARQSLAEIFDCKNKFRDGIYYGLGGMEIHFEEFFFMLKGMPRVIGHIGILSTQLFYDPVSKTHIIMNFGSDSKMQDSFMALIQAITVLKKVKLKIRE